MDTTELLARVTYLVFAARPGGGKHATADAFLRKMPTCSHLEMSASLVKETEARTALGLQIKQYFDAGTLVPDDVVNQKLVMGIRERALEGSTEIILDGYPRNPKQFEFLFGLGSSLLFFYIDIPRNVAVERMLQRGKPGEKGNRSLCERRQDVFEEHTLPMVDLFFQNLPRSSFRVRAIDERGGEISPCARANYVRNRVKEFNVSRQIAGLVAG